MHRGIGRASPDTPAFDAGVSSQSHSHLKVAPLLNRDAEQKPTQRESVLCTSALNVGGHRREGRKAALSVA
jgi:hypothetical protein